MYYSITKVGVSTHQRLNKNIPMVVGTIRGRNSVICGVYPNAQIINVCILKSSKVEPWKQHMDMMMGKRPQSTKIEKRYDTFRVIETPRDGVYDVYEIVR